LRRGQLRFRVPVVLWLVLCAAGCGQRGVVPRTPDDVRGYLQAPPGLAGLDPSPLRGRRILIDPGHGGRFRGAIGDRGLAEADVNLGVALYLQGLLQWAGADVHLTRTADVDFTTPTDSSLAGDLAARVALCDGLAPEVFVSIHHNSNAARDPVLNETQTYYPLGREGADLDLARAIHRQLVRLLAIEPARILPGGFHVLRNASVPAVLGEPAMLSNPVIEGRLTLARSLELEASAYFLGLRDYFAGGTPRWLTDLPDTVEVGLEAPPLVWTFDAGAPDSPPLDPTTIEVRIDGRPAAYDLSGDGRTVAIVVPDLDAVTGELRGRNHLGRAADARRVVVRRPALASFRWWIAAERDTTHPDYAAYANTGLLLIYETPGHDLRDFDELFATCERGGFQLPRYPGERGWYLYDRREIKEKGWIRQICARAFDRGLRPDGGMRTVPFEQGEGDKGESGVLEPGVVFLHLTCPQDVWPDRTVPGDGWRTRLPLPESTAWLFKSTLRSPRPRLDRLSPVVPVRQDGPVWLEADGALPLVSGLSGDAAPGGTATLRPDTLTWQPLLPALIGRRVAIDPRGGGTDEQGRGPLGTRGSEVNLAVARRLAALLRGAGCEVALLREAELWTPDPERVRRADRFAADLYLAIGRGDLQVRHHAGSAFGGPWAASCARALTALQSDTVAVTTGDDYVLRHTACPAIVVQLEDLASAEAETRAAAPAWQDAVARAVFAGTVALLVPDAELLRIDDLLASLGPRALPRDRLDRAVLDGNLHWLPPPGQPFAPGLPSGEPVDRGLPVRGDRHVLELHAGPLWQLWALERQPPGTWQGRMLLENR